MIEAKFYTKLDNSTVKCTLCPHECILKKNQRGICLARVNIDGKLYSKAYSNLCALNIDPIEKKPLYHFLPNSKTLSIAHGGCNLKCLNCQNFHISQDIPENVELYKITPEELVKIALNKNIYSISYTYTEPLVAYEYLLDTAEIAYNNNIKNIIVSAAYINKEPLRKIVKFIDAANIDIKSFDEEFYKKINKGTLQPILENILFLKEKNVWVELTYLVIPSLNDDINVLEKFVEWLKINNLQSIPIHFSKFHPTYKLNNIRETPSELITKIVEYFYSEGIKYVYSGNLWGDKYENTFCPSCKKLIIERFGYNVNKINIINNNCNFCGHKIDGLFHV